MTEPSYQQQMQQQGTPPADLRDAPLDQPDGRQPASLSDAPVDQPVPPADLADGHVKQPAYDDTAVSGLGGSDGDPTDPAGQTRDAAGLDRRSDERLSTADLAGTGVGAADPSDPSDPSEGAALRADGDPKQALFPEDDANSLRERWRDVQAGFVDEPRRAVQDADALVADLMQRLAETFASERSSLEGQWDRTGDVSTEEMRVALQRYRSFFDRLLSV